MECSTRGRWVKCHCSNILYYDFFRITKLFGAENEIIRENYRQTSDISFTLVSNEIVDHSWCSWSITRRRCSNHIFILQLTPGFNGLDKDNCKTRRETCKFWDSVRLIIKVWRYVKKMPYLLKLRASCSSHSSGSAEMDPMITVEMYALLNDELSILTTILKTWKRCPYSLSFMRPSTTCRFLS